MDNFDDLLKALNDVESDTPAAPAPGEDTDDESIAAAAADGDNDGEPDGDEGKEGEAAPVAKGGKPAPVMAKSFAFVDDNGNEQEAVDATDLIKSIMAKQDQTSDVLAKALSSVTATMAKQNDMLKSMQARLDVLAGQGKGRKTVLTVSEKPNVGDTNVMAKSQNAITPADLMAKANAAFDAGKITGRDLNVVSVCLRQNEKIDAGLLSKIALA